MDDYSVQFGKRFRQILDDRGIKYSFAAEKMGWSKQLLHAKLLGQNKWRLDEALTAIKLFDLPKDILL